MIASVTTTIPDQNGKMVWWFVEFPEIDDLEHLTEILVEDGVIDCQKLKVWKMSPDTSRIIAREPLVLGKGIIGTITLPHVNLVEA